MVALQIRSADGTIAGAARKHSSNRKAMRLNALAAAIRSTSRQHTGGGRPSRRARRAQALARTNSSRRRCWTNCVPPPTLRHCTSRRRWRSSPPRNRSFPRRRSSPASTTLFIRPCLKWHRTCPSAALLRRRHSPLRFPRYFLRVAGASFRRDASRTSHLRASRQRSESLCASQREIDRHHHGPHSYRRHSDGDALGRPRPRRLPLSSAQ